MRIATWNVNSIRVRLPQVLKWLGKNLPDVLCLQETKVTDEDFPIEALRQAGYHAAYAGQKTYNGVATLTREPGSAVLTSLPGMDDAQRRLVAVNIGMVRVINVYVPNGEEVGSEKYAYKLSWLKALTAHVSSELKTHPQLVLLGDFNIAPEERDVHDPVVWAGHVLFSDRERRAFRELIETGLVDMFRKFDQPAGSFSWWDYRQGAFRRNMGLRIDHILCGPVFASACDACRIDREPRGYDRPSDHAPVIADFRL